MSFSLLLDLMLMVQLWPIRAELSDVFAHGSASLLGGAVVLVQLFVVDSQLGDSDDNQPPASSSNMAALACSGGVVLLVALRKQTRKSNMLHSTRCIQRVAS